MDSLLTHIIDVGHGDSIIIEFPHSENASKIVVGIIDCNNSEKVLHYIKHRILSGREINSQTLQVRFIAATHPHRDHIWGFRRLIRALMRKGITPGVFWYCGIRDYKIVYTFLLKEILDANISAWAITASREGWTLCGIDFILLAPPFDYRQLMDKPHDPTHQDVNNVSGVILMRYGNSRILFGADAQSASWGWIESNMRDEMRAQVLKVSHHGSIYGTVLEHVDTRIVPTYAIISGPDSLANPIKLPHPITVSTLRRTVNQSNLFCTADHGNICIISDNTGNHRIRTQNQ